MRSISATLLAIIVLAFGARIGIGGLIYATKHHEILPAVMSGVLMVLAVLIAIFIAHYFKRAVTSH